MPVQNLSCLAIAVECLTAPALLPNAPPSLVEPAWAKHALLGVAFAGAMAGMVAMGYIGDRIGRRRGMIMTLAFVVSGALGAALLTWGDADTFFGMLCAWRLVLGFGVGGIYPMAAATAQESDGPGDTEDAKSLAQAAVRVGWVFFWQAPGAALPYVLAVCLTFLAPPGVAWAGGAEFRLVVGFGAAIAAVPLVAAYYSQEHAPLKADRPNRTLRKAQGVYAAVPAGDAVEADGAPAPAALQSAPDAEGARAAPSQSPWLTLIGTGGAWFLYDVVLYSTSLFTPQIIESIFGRGEGAVAIAWESLFVTLFGIPAVSVLVHIPLGPFCSHSMFSPLRTRSAQLPFGLCNAAGGGGYQFGGSSL